jgi:hypothetical protein
MYPEYNFDKTDDYRAFRFTYKKSAANLSIDDVEATYGDQELVYIFQDREVSGSSYSINELDDNNTYYYRVRNTLGSAISDYSEDMKVETLIDTYLTTGVENPYRFFIQNNQIQLSNLKGNEQVEVYSITGLRMLQKEVGNVNSLNLAFAHKGMFILVISKNGERSVSKFVN